MLSQTPLNLTVLDKFPAELLECDATNLHKLLRGPTLIHMEGNIQPAIFVSVLLHGNETTGWDAIRLLMRRYLRADQTATLPRSLSLFIGNIRAAQMGKRLLEDQIDYNRIWPTETNQSVSAEHDLARQVFDIMQQRGVFLSIDIHNNTGLNPHYSCINKLDNDYAYVAHLFSNIIIQFTYPDGVQSQAFSIICPSVTIECGQIGFKHGTSHAHEFLETCLQLQYIPSEADHQKEIIFYENFATVTVVTGVRFCFDNAGDVSDKSQDLIFYPQLDQYNFTDLRLGTPIAQVVNENVPLIKVTTNDGVDVTKDYFQIKDGLLVNRVAIMPSMLTSDVEIVAKDCLCYLMRRILA